MIYPGSIERVDFGEVADDKFFVIAHRRARESARVEWRKLDGVRPFVDRFVRLTSRRSMSPNQILAVLPPAEELEGAIVRLVLDYPRDWEKLIDDAALRESPPSLSSFTWSSARRWTRASACRKTRRVGSLTPLELLDLYWKASHIPAEELVDLRKLAQEIIQEGEKGVE